MAEISTDAPSFPMARANPLNPPEPYAGFRQGGEPQKVKLWNGDVAWLFTSFEDVRAVLADNRFSTVPTTPGFPMLSPARDALLREPPTFLRMDPPDHGRFRRMLTKEFMVKKVDALRPRIQALVDRLIADMKKRGPPAEIVEDFALPLTSTVISDLLGVPYDDSAFFQEQSRLKVLMDVDPEVPRQASIKIFEYLDRLITAKEANPGDDLLSRLVVDQVLPGNITHDEAVRLADLLLMAGHETTANQIALGLVSFFVNPGEREKLIKDPSLVKTAVDEMLRFHSIVHYNGARVALEDVEVNGFRVPKGQGVFALVNAGNRDPSMFPEPNRFDIARKADNHLAFSYGVHQCLGQPLARAELQTVFTTIFRALPGLRMAVPFEAITFKSSHFVYGVDSLPVEWDQADNKSL